MVHVELSPTEMQIANAISKGIQDFYGNSKNKRAIDTSLTQEYRTNEMVYSEMCVSKYLNLYPFSTFVFDKVSLDDGTDLGDIKYCGKTIDIKSTRHKNGRMVVPYKNDNIDVYILTIGEKGSYNIIGGMYAKDLIVPERYILPPNFKKKSYVAQQSELIPIDKLLLDIRNKKE